MGKLYIVPTPVGNLEDISYRAIRILKEVDLILAEDTRTSSVLMKHFEISTKLSSHHKFNEKQSTQSVIDKLESGIDIALISDAGTPLISDPGYFLVNKCVEEGIIVECLPGATAFVPALVNSGFNTESFCFEGFLPHKKGRQTKIMSLVDETRTMIFYESPNRLLKCLEQFKEAFGEERRVSISREISKFHEENFRGTICEVIAHFSSKTVKGEIVIVLEGKEIKKEKKKYIKKDRE
ncbi:MAG: 16S rRNA (cytidine(1402)-2'-O)-methyltransferase [Marinifilaceae bacterium]|jgi:16S rRNA (cytidine1402-2'-O)-methyltransferase|nr:16S rRNA (cytidine(1402)-2'-O)-methyltransferase [Marinifilaceae bacterium]